MTYWERTSTSVSSISINNKYLLTPKCLREAVLDEPISRARCLSRTALEISLKNEAPLEFTEPVRLRRL